MLEAWEKAALIMGKKINWRLLSSGNHAIAKFRFQNLGAFLARSRKKPRYPFQSFCLRQKVFPLLSLARRFKQAACL
jgi:hypothetical protein